MLEQQRSYVSNYFARRARAPPHARALACSKSSQVNASRLRAILSMVVQTRWAFWSSCSTRREQSVGLFTQQFTAKRSTVLTVRLGEMLRVPYLFGRARRIAQPLGPKQTCAPRRWYSPPMGNATPEEISETQLQVGRVLKTLGVGWLMYKSYQIACGSGMIFTGDARCACMPWTHGAHALGLLLGRYVPDFAITRAGAVQESGESRDRYLARASLAFGRSRVARGRCTGRRRGAARDASERAARDAPHSPRATDSHGALGQRAGKPHRQRGGLPRHR